MRTSLWLRCAASGAAAGAASTPASPKVSGAKTGPLTTGWRSFTFKPWQLQAVEAVNEAATMPTTVLYLGDQLGPRPLVILDQSVTLPDNATEKAVNDACSAAATKYEPLLSALAWEHGAVYVPLSVSLGEKQTMARSCRNVCAVLDALGVQWTHVLAHSYGALVAARMAASTLHPHRIGTLLLLDTPLVTEPLVRNTRQREEIAKAREDVNVPPAELAFAIESLKGSLEAPLPYPAAADKTLYEDYLFHPSSIFREGGLMREEDRYIPVRHLAQVHHPLQLIVPAKESVTDVAIHKEFFSLRRPATVKGASSHEDLFASRCATEVADVVRTWVQRFEPDVLLKRRFEQAAKEMGQLMGDVAPSEKSAEAGEKKGEKKKEKKKKGKA